MNQPAEEERNSSQSPTSRSDYFDMLTSEIHQKIKEETSMPQSRVLEPEVLPQDSASQVCLVTSAREEGQFRKDSVMTGGTGSITGLI